MTAHPARYSDPLLPVLARYVRTAQRILDPFAGTGKIGQIRQHGVEGWIHANELEPEWARQAIGNGCDFAWVGDATRLPWPDGWFDAIVTSPCLAHGNRILTADLRWVPVEDIKVGDEVMAFDEHSGGVKPGGQPMRRRWKRATVVRSFPDRQPCVRVVMENGDSVVTTKEHPWLANKYSHKSEAGKWVASVDLMSSPYVMKQMDTWTERTSYDAGWLAGMFDGEGSLSLGAHGSPKMVVCQVVGPVLDRMEALMREFGYAPNRLNRTGAPAHRQQMANLYVTDGFPGLMRALGELRPMRLLAKWAELDVSTRTIQPKRVRVVAIEDAGEQTIQVIETSEGTYIGEGYLMHNCYGNRMADHADWADGRVHTTYKGHLGRALHPNNSGRMPWGDRYRALHAAAWSEAVRLLTPGGVLVVNCSDHIRDGVVVDVCAWHRSTITGLGLMLAVTVHVPTRRQRNGANGQARVACEQVMVFRKAGPA